jgi:hypothetical protein
VPSAAPPPSPWPRVIAEGDITGLSVVLATVLLGGMVITVAWHRSQSTLPGTGPAAHPGRDLAIGLSKGLG